MTKERDDLEGYVIYSDGRIWSKTKNRFLNPNVTDTGHLQIELQRNGKPYYIRVHRLVFETFVRPLKKGEVVHHVDFCPSNNNVDNLIAMSRSEHTAMHNKGNNYHLGKKFSDQTKQKLKKAWVRRKDRCQNLKS